MKYELKRFDDRSDEIFATKTDTLQTHAYVSSIIEPLGRRGYELDRYFTVLLRSNPPDLLNVNGSTCTNPQRLATNGISYINRSPL